MNKQVNERIYRAMKHKMFLISANKIDNYNWIFCVEGSKEINYFINFNNKCMTCECPDFKLRKKICKHIYFIIKKICNLNIDLLNNNDPNINIYDIYTNISSILDDILYKRINKKIINYENDDCSICFENMSEGLLDKCNICKNSFHNDCIIKWLSNSTRTNCPLCRSIWIKDIDALAKLKIN